MDETRGEEAAWDVMAWRRRLVLSIAVPVGAKFAFWGYNRED